MSSFQYKRFYVYSNEEIKSDQHGGKQIVSALTELKSQHQFFGIKIEN
jgi:hypothetical protein